MGRGGGLEDSCVKYLFSNIRMDIVSLHMLLPEKVSDRTHLRISYSGAYVYRSMLKFILLHEEWGHSHFLYS